MQQLESGEDFGHLAMFNSECPSKAQGGDLGWFGKGEPNTHRSTHTMYTTLT